MDGQARAGGRGRALADARGRAYISPTSRLYLAYISPMSPLYLTYISLMLEVAPRVADKDLPYISPHLPTSPNISPRSQVAPCVADAATAAHDAPAGRNASARICTASVVRVFKARMPPYVSLYLACISPVSRQHLANISPISRQCLASPRRRCACAGRPTRGVTPGARSRATSSR